MSDKEFSEFLNAVTGYDPQLLPVTYFGSPEPKREKRFLQLRDKLLSVGYPEKDFDEKYLVFMQQAGELIPEPPPSFFDGKRFLHNVMGDYLIRRYSVCKINDAVHVYDNGVYKPGEEMLHGYMINLLPEITDAKRREVYKYIKANRKTPVKEVSPPNLIPFASKIYDLETDSFLEYSPEYVFLNRFPYDYKPNAAPCSLVTDTIGQIADGDKEVISLLYEAMGNCFYLLNSYRGAVMLYGRSGNNGKSTLLNMITQLVGESNASFLSLQDTAEKFRLTEVYGKAVNIGDDIPNSYFPDSATFKKLVTGERLIAEKKGQDPFGFTPYAKLFFSMNDLPAVSDKSRAFFGRILLIPLNRDFSKGGKRNVHLKARKWTKEEMEYLTVLAMDGLKRLRENGDFTKPACVLQALAEYEAENNPVIPFLEEYGEIGERTPTALVYEVFQKWCMDNGHRNVLTQTRFSREVCRIRGLSTESKRLPAYGGKTGRCFVEKHFSVIP